MTKYEKIKINMNKNYNSISIILNKTVKKYPQFECSFMQILSNIQYLTEVSTPLTFL